ncbi:MAG TPA: hypothetical protein VD931_03710 [Baekduia sp.]|nr:hypothetical protein [Baekduia sp.]
MNRRGFLRTAIAGLLGCALPAGLLAGGATAVRTVIRAGRALYVVGIDHGVPYNTATIEMVSRDDGATWELFRPEPPPV